MSNTTNNGNHSPPAPIAVIGMGCLFPQADGVRAYWANIKKGIDAITDVPETHWRPEDYFDADPKSPDHTYGRRGGFLTPIDFDPLAYGMPPNTIEATDTSQLLGMVVATEALRDAGYGSDREFNRDRVSVVLGVTGALELVVPLGARLSHPHLRQSLKDAGVDDTLAEDVLQRFSDSYVQWQEASFPGLLGNVVAGRISKHLNLGGTNCVVDAACASSLSAMHLAGMELANGRADMVVTGGVDTFNDIFMYMCFSKTPALSPTGDAKPFDAAGDGTILGEGLGVVVLKRLADAERDGDRVYAVIRGVGTSSDGKGEAIYAPSAPGQVKAIRDAYTRASVTPDTIELVEAHGTGTVVGDATEVRALTEVYGHSDNGPWCAIGSVKSQVGHTKAAAGAAGIIKAVCALHAKVVPPTTKVSEPLDVLRDNGTPFYVNTSPRPWVASHDHPRRAAVSSFGFGGSNFHCVLEEYGATKAAPDWDGDVEILPFAANSVDQLKQSLNDALALESWDEFRRHAQRLRNEAQRGGHRIVLVLEQGGDTSKTIHTALKALDETSSAQSWSLPNGVFYGMGSAPGKLALLFPGQGSQYVGMLRELACTFPEILDALSKADAIFAEGDDASHRLSDCIYPQPAFDAAQSAEQEKRLQDTRIAQPALGAISAGLFKALARFGVSPDAVAGHSYGELVALYAAERFDENALYRLSQVRGALMAGDGGDNGTMLAVKAAITDIAAVLESERLDLVVANKNAPKQAVLSGSRETISHAEQLFKDRGMSCVPLSVAAAFHSAFVSNAEHPFADALNAIPWNVGAIPVYCNTTSAVYPSDTTEAKALLASQLARPVEFVCQIETMYADGVTTFIECGPGARLTGLVDAILTKQPHHAFAIDPSNGRKSGMAGLARALAQTWALGHNVNLKAWNAEAPAPDAPAEKPKFTVSLSGANYRKPHEPRPPMPTPKAEAKPIAPPEPDQQPTTEKTAQAATLGAMSPNSQPQYQNPLPPRIDMSDAFRAAQENLAALQKLQEQTAQVHQKFLEGQQAAAQTFQKLLDQQQQLYAGGPVSASPPAYPSLEEEVAQHAARSAEPAPEVAPEPSVAKMAALEESFEERSGIDDILLAVVADKTGYPVEMLELDMALDADLGIDSIKRVEILSALQEQLPGARQVDSRHLGTLHTLRDVIAYLGEEAEEGAASHETPIPAPDEHLERVLIETVAEKTGYPPEMLELDMALDTDLGIDSIKRVEILSALQEQLPELPAVESKQLGQFHTLRDVVGHLSNRAAAPVSANGNGTNIETALIAAVADKTGYPPEMLELEMAFDTDLGIDSIKRVEILSALQEQLPELPQVDSKDLGRLTTLHDVVEYLAGANGASSSTTDTAAEGDTSHTRTPRRAELTDAVLQAIPLSPVHKRPRVELPGNGVLWIVHEDQVFSGALETALIDTNVSVQRMTVSEAATTDAPENLSGLVFVAPAKWGDLQLLKTFPIFQHAAKPLRANAGLFATVSCMDGAFGLASNDGSFDPAHGALAGFVKSAGHEWPEVHCKTIDVAPGWAGADCAKAVAEELFADGPIEVGLSKAGACTLELGKRKQNGPGRGVAFTDNDVVLITGGARGVTAEAAVTLAQSFQPTLVLLGRSTAPNDEPSWLANLEDEAAIKRALMERANGDANPRMIGDECARILAHREIRRNIARMEAAGARVRYEQVNVTDASSMATTLHQLQEETGPVTAVVHGAGILADRLIEDKTREQFAAVYDTKVQGLRNALDNVDANRLKALVLFSSSTGRFGRKGQADYAAANEVLNKWAQRFAREHPACCVRSLNWGPWAGGMVTPSLAKMFEEEGIGLIDPAAGARFLVEELAKSDGAVEIVVMAGGLEPTTPNQPSSSPRTKLNRVLSLDIDVERFSFLRSHVLNNRAVLPAAVSMEWLAQGAAHANPGLHIVGLQDFRVLKGVVLEDGVYLLHLCAGPLELDEKRYEIAAELRGGEDVLHVSTTVIAANTPSIAPEAPVDAAMPYGNGHTYSYASGPLFHGPHFHGIEAVSFPSPTLAVARAQTAPRPSEWMEEPLRRKWIFDPLAIDCAFQLMALWSYEHHGVVSLPSRFGEFRQFVREWPRDGVQLVARISHTGAHCAVADFEFVDTASRTLVATIKECECTLDESLNEAFARNALHPQPAVHP